MFTLNVSTWTMFAQPIYKEIKNQVTQIM